MASTGGGVTLLKVFSISCLAVTATVVTIHVDKLVNIDKRTENHFHVQPEQPQRHEDPPKLGWQLKLEPDTEVEPPAGAYNDPRPREQIIAETTPIRPRKRSVERRMRPQLPPFEPYVDPSERSVPEPNDVEPFEKPYGKSGRKSPVPFDPDDFERPYSQIGKTPIPEPEYLPPIDDGSFERPFDRLGRIQEEPQPAPRFNPTKLYYEEQFFVDGQWYFRYSCADCGREIVTSPVRYTGPNIIRRPTMEPEEFPPA